ncbi:MULTISPECIES: hypothetical protein [unclassified Mesorhizobium]|nr:MULTISPECIES: hypothetical protein [unclassified Mesorhizobium]
MNDSRSWIWNSAWSSEIVERDATSGDRRHRLAREGSSEVAAFV